MQNIAREQVMEIEAKVGQFGRPKSLKPHPELGFILPVDTA